MSKILSPVIPYLYQWLLLPVWIGFLAWSFYFSGGSPDPQGALFQSIINSLPLAGPVTVDWSLVGFFLLLGLNAFGLYLLVLGQQPTRGSFLFKTVFFVLSILFGSFVFALYVIFQRAEPTKRPESAAVRDFAANPWSAVAFLLMYFGLIFAITKLGNPLVLIDYIASSNLVQVWFADFCFYWLLSAILLIGDLWENRQSGGLPVWTAALGLVPMAGPILYLVLKNFSRQASSKSV